MKIETILLTLIALVRISTSTFARPQGKQPYNFTRALGEEKKGNKADALDHLQKEISDNPSNGYAHMTIAILHADAEKYGDAMTSINPDDEDVQEVIGQMLYELKRSTILLQWKKIQKYVVSLILFIVLGAMMYGSLQVKR